MPTDWTDDARRRLLDLRQGPGVWGYRARSRPAAEPSCLAALALIAGGRESSDDRAIALATARRLASTRNADGSVGVVADLPGPGWPTPFALLLWSALGRFEAERAAAIDWLLGIAGTTKAHVQDDPLGHDGTIVGWPWIAGTHSWVEPTAQALLALAKEGRVGHPRALDGVRLLVDRAIPSGGWNLGNPVVFGTALRPLPGPTGLALLALAATRRRSEAVDAALGYLREALAGTLAPISLGWGLLGLRAWGAEPPEAASWLGSAFAALGARAAGTGPVELAMLLLAAGPGSLDRLGIEARPDRSTSSPEANHRA